MSALDPALILLPFYSALCCALEIPNVSAVNPQGSETNCPHGSVSAGEQKTRGSDLSLDYYG